MAKYTVDDHWESIKQKIANGIFDKNEISSCMAALNRRDEQPIIPALKKYIRNRDTWSYLIKGKNWKELYYQHFPE